MFFRVAEGKHRVVELAVVDKLRQVDKVVEWWVDKGVLYQFLNS
jgi:hypothetical protein